MEEEKARKSLKYSVYDGTAFAVMDGMTASFLTPFAVALNASVNLIAALVIAILFFLFFRIPLMVRSIINLQSDNLFFSVNNVSYFRELFWKNYGFILSSFEGERGLLV